MQAECAVCGEPTDGTVCRREVNNLAAALRQIEILSPEVETTVARLCRYAVRGGRRAPQVEQDDTPRAAGGLRVTPLPVDLHASARAAGAFTAVTTWARLVSEHRGQDLPVPVPGEHPAAVAAQWLQGHVEWLRHQPFAAEAVDELRAAAATITRVVDAPPPMVVVGVCDCGAHLYAHHRASTVRCADCGARWDVESSRDTLREALRDRLVTAAEGAILAVLVHPDEDRSKTRDLIRTWAARGLLTTRQVDDMPAYPFGEIIDRVTRHVVAKLERGRATVTASGD